MIDDCSEPGVLVSILITYYRWLRRKIFFMLLVQRAPCAFFDDMNVAENLAKVIMRSPVKSIARPIASTWWNTERRRRLIGGCRRGTTRVLLLLPKSTTLSYRSGGYFGSYRGGPAEGPQKVLQRTASHKYSLFLQDLCRRPPAGWCGECIYL